MGRTESRLRRRPLDPNRSRKYVVPRILCNPGSDKGAYGIADEALHAQGCAPSTIPESPGTGGRSVASLPTAPKSDPTGAGSAVGGSQGSVSSTPWLRKFGAKMGRGTGTPAGRPLRLQNAAQPGIWTSGRRFRPHVRPLCSGRCWSPRVRPHGSLELSRRSTAYHCLLRCTPPSSIFAPAPEDTGASTCLRSVFCVSRSGPCHLACPPSADHLP